MLDGAARLTDLFDHAKELGMESVATTDHGFVFGAFDFWTAKQTKAVAGPVSAPPRPPRSK